MQVYKKPQIFVFFFKCVVFFKLRDNYFKIRFKKKIQKEIL